MRLTLEKSFNGSKCDTLSGKSYRTLTGTTLKGVSFHASLTMLSTSKPKRSLIVRIFDSGSNGQARYPVCVSGSLIPVSTRNQKLLNLFPNELLPGISLFPMSRAPITIAERSSTTARAMAGRSAGSCWASLSMVIACVQPNLRASAKPVRSALPLPLFTGILTTHMPSTEERMLAVPSVDPSSTTITCGPAYEITCRNTLSKVTALL